MGGRNAFCAQLLVLRFERNVFGDQIIVVRLLAGQIDLQQLNGVQCLVQFRLQLFRTFLLRVRFVPLRYQLLVGLAQLRLEILNPLLLLRR